MFVKPTICAIAVAGVLSLALVRPAPAQDVSQRGQRESDDSQQQQGNFQNRQGQDRSEQGQGQNSTLSGTVQSYREANVNGTPHFRIRLRTQDGRTRTVDLGPSSQSRELIDNVEEGEQISVQGSQQDVNGKQVFEADRARVGGKSYSIENQPEQSEEQQNERPGAQRGQQSPRALVFLEQRYVFLTPSDLSRHLIMARENLRTGDNKAAAGELRVAAERLGVYAAAARNQGKVGQDLNNSRQELDRLADEVERPGKNQQPEQLDEPAARAQLAMARFFDNRFRSQEQRGRSIEAGYDLQAAAIHARAAQMWSNQNARQDSVRSIREAMRTSDQLISGNEQQAENAQQVADNLSRQIDQIDRQIGEGQAQEAGAHQEAEQDQARSRQQQQQKQQQRDDQDKD